MTSASEDMDPALPGYVVVELIGAEDYQGPEGFWVRGLYHLIPANNAKALLAMQNSVGQPLFRMHP